MNKDKREKNSDNLILNTYCVFTKEKQNVTETVGLMFKDYIESQKIKDK